MVGDDGKHAEITVFDGMLPGRYHSPRLLRTCVTLGQFDPGCFALQSIECQLLKSKAFPK